MLKIRRKNYCANKCIRFQQIVNNTDIPAIEQNTGFQQIKIQKGGAPQFRNFTINQFGRIAGTGGRPLSNF
jgi:hypothetical protein